MSHETLINFVLRGTFVRYETNRSLLLMKTDEFNFQNTVKNMLGTPPEPVKKSTKKAKSESEQPKKKK